MNGITAGTQTQLSLAVNTSLPNTIADAKRGPRSLAGFSENPLLPWKSANPPSTTPIVRGLLHELGVKTIPNINNAVPTN